jgi:hypothetical protein
MVKGTVLDAACGCGYGSKIMQDSGAFVTGIDLEQEAIEYARKYYPGPEYILADVTKYHGRYNWVVSFETLEHLPDPVPALVKFRESKHLIISTPNQENYPFRPESYEGDRFPHVKHYMPLELDELLKNNNWEVIERFCQPKKTSPVVEGTDGMFLIYVCR